MLRGALSNEPMQVARIVRGLPATLDTVAGTAERLPQVAHLVISNVPGPQVPLYLAGARVLCKHPTSIVVHGLALNITVQSFDASMDFGLMADASALPGVKALALPIDEAMQALRALPVSATGQKAAKKVVKEAVAMSRKRPATLGRSARRPRSVR